MNGLLAGLCGLVALLSAHAAEVRMLAWDESVAARPLVWIHGEEAIELSDLHPLRRSKAYPGPANGAPLVIRATDRAPADGQAPAELRLDLDARLRHPLLILLPDPRTPSGLHGLVVEDDPSAFRWGTMRFLNATTEPVVVQCERKAVRVPAGWKPVDLRPGGESRNVGIRVALDRTIATPAYTSVWDHREDTRSLIFILQGGNSRLGSLTLKAVPEVREPVAPTDEGS